GCISLGGRGQLVDWQLFNRPSIGFNPACFFALHCRGLADTGADADDQTRVLEVELAGEELDGAHGSPSKYAGRPRFRDGSFAAAYPFGVVHMSDPDLPLDVRVGAFNPLVPGDADASGIPVFMYRVAVRNRADHPLRVSVCANMPNVVGATQRADRGW